MEVIFFSWILPPPHLNNLSYSFDESIRQGVVLGGPIQQVIQISRRDPEPFDWYQRFSGLKDIITTHVDKGHKILNVGAGNSRLSEEMFEEGYTQITNIDISNVCVKAMKEKYKEKPETFKYLLMDARTMDFPEASFDAVIDKATIDSVLVLVSPRSAAKTPRPMRPR